MTFLRKLFGKTATPAAPAPEHAVLVSFEYGEATLKPLFALERRLLDAVSSAGAGEYDGHEIAVDLSHGTLYMYGPDADALFTAVQPVLAATPFLAHARVTLRYGPPEDGVRQQEISVYVH